ncbi:MAG: hypothetical protein JXA10_02450 [Anaerolineae bacterium]|nr:hypothetical protein [Anaerolineae bacterium]
MTENGAWGHFLLAARGEEPPQVPVALAADCRYIANALDMNMLDFLLYPERWLNAYLTLIARFPDVLFLPGFWVEFGMATEASAFGASVLWRSDHAPTIRPLHLPAEQWGEIPQPDPYTDGLMALALHRYWNLEHNGELPEPHRIRFAAARGPFAIASHLVGTNAFMGALADERQQRHALNLVETLTDTTIRYLQAQLGCLRAPMGIMLIDDTTGMLTTNQFERLAAPILNRIFAAFDGLVRIYHNSTPCVHLLSGIAHLDFEVFHFSHQMDIRSVKAALQHKAVMGNLAPLGTVAHGTPEQIQDVVRRSLDSLTDYAGVILSAGGMVQPDTPPENIDALFEATRR